MGKMKRDEYSWRKDEGSWRKQQRDRGSDGDAVME
jgi:hypothetical protein